MHRSLGGAPDRSPQDARHNCEERGRELVTWAERADPRLQQPTEPTGRRGDQHRHQKHRRLEPLVRQPQHLRSIAEAGLWLAQKQI